LDYAQSSYTTREHRGCLDFHIFEVNGFNILIGHPIKKLFLDAHVLGTLDMTLGEYAFSNNIIEHFPYEESIVGVWDVSKFEPPKVSSKENAKLFIDEEDDPRE
jgi:hypothetical protein